MIKINSILNIFIFLSDVLASRVKFEAATLKILNHLSFETKRLFTIMLVSFLPRKTQSSYYYCSCFIRTIFVNLDGSKSLLTLSYKTTANDMTLIQGLPPKWSLIDLHHCFYIVYLLTAKNIAVSNYTISSLLQYINFLINFDEKTFECLLVQICYRPSERSVRYLISIGRVIFFAGL